MRVMAQAAIKLGQGGVVRYRPGPTEVQDEVGWEKDDFGMTAMEVVVALAGPALDHLKPELIVVMCWDFSLSLFSLSTSKSTQVRSRTAVTR